MYIILCTCLPHKAKMQYLHFQSHAEYFLSPWKIHELVDNQCSSITKDSIFYIKCMCKLLAWKWIDQIFDVKMEISAMFYICTYNTEFILRGVDVHQYAPTHQTK